MTKMHGGNRSGRLDRMTQTLHLGRDGLIKLQAQGWSENQRKALWTTSEEWQGDDPVYGPSDAAHHLVLAILQDRPNTQERLFFSLNGGIGWVEEEMFPGA